MTPIPPLVTAATTPAMVRERLVAALERVGTDASLAHLREALLITGFESVTADDYGVLAAIARRTDALGYARLQ
jgi:hypothetical protein